jgi:hypothetical protein
MVVLLGSRKLLAAGNMSKADEQIPSCQLRGPEFEHFHSSLLHTW